MKVFTYDYLELNGRLGNQLWQIASTIGLANREGAPARFKPEWQYRPFFSVPDVFFDAIPESAERVDRGTDYLQEVQYLDGVEADIKTYFRPSERSLEHLNLHYKGFAEIPNKCALHVRRGDYLKYPDHFSVMTDKYWNDALDLVGPDVNVVVFSDDHRWVQRKFADRKNFHFVLGRPRPVEVVDRVGEPADQWDLFLMTMCQHHIISNSTFSWWGAYLSHNPHPIYPDKWFEKELAYIPAEKMFTPDWRMVSC